MQGPDRLICYTTVKAIQVGQDTDWVVKKQQITDEVISFALARSTSYTYYIQKAVQSRKA